MAFNFFNDGSSIRVEDGTNKVYIDKFGLTITSDVNQVFLQSATGKRYSYLWTDVVLPVSASPEDLALQLEAFKDLNDTTIIIGQQTNGLILTNVASLGVGQEAKLVAPTGKSRVLHSARIEFVTSATAINRRVNFGMRDVASGKYISLTGSTITQGASLTYVYHFGFNAILPQFLVGSGGNPNRAVIPLINPGKPLCAITNKSGTQIWSLETQTDNLQAGDNFTVQDYTIQEIDYIG